jgi:hypothetical protein
MHPIVAAALAAILAPTVALAQPDTRFSDAQFLRAARCVALSSSPALRDESGDTAWLASALKAQERQREEFVLTKARNDAEDIRWTAKRANTEAKIAKLRAQRLEECRDLSQPLTDQATVDAHPGG